MQKCFTVDFLTKTTKVNEGEVPKYYVQNSHPAIIEPCPTPHRTEDEIKQRFVVAFNILLGSRDELFTNCRMAQEVLCDYSSIEAELEELQREIKVVSELTRKYIYGNASFAVNLDELNGWHRGYMEHTG